MWSSSATPSCSYALILMEIYGWRCPEAPKHIDLQQHASFPAIALMGIAQSIQEASAAPLITATSCLAWAALNCYHGPSGLCWGRNECCVLGAGTHQRGSSFPITLMREPGLSQVINPSVHPLHTKTQAQKPAVFAQWLLSHHCHPAEVICEGHPPLFLILSSPFQRLAASRLITPKCSQGRRSL